MTRSFRSDLPTRSTIPLTDPDIEGLPERFVRAYRDLVLMLHGLDSSRSQMVVPPGRGKPIRQSGYKRPDLLPARDEADELMQRCADELVAAAKYARRTLERTYNRLDECADALEKELDK